MNWKEFKPTIFFLLKFLGLYLAGNIVYGLFVTAYEPQADPVTRWVTDHTVAVLNTLGWSGEAVDHPSKATVAIVYESRAIVSVYEGCNGINVMVIFVSFLFSFGPVGKKMLWFMPLGLIIIHISNLARIALLFLVSLKMPDYLYFSHKYLFTAFIYAVVLLLWVLWVKYTSVKPDHAK
jgi:exosortase family protein XrtF